MNSLIIYDSTGFIISQMAGSVREPVGIPFMWLEVPKGKRIVSIDVSTETYTPIFENLPKSEIEVLKDQLQATQQAVDFLLMGGM